jgi:hypothetical protein
MAKKSEPKAERPRVLATVARLVTVADGDTLYRDVYLRRASELLSPFVTEAQYASALTSREQLDMLLARTRSAVAQQDWLQVRELGAQAADLQRSLATDQESQAAAEAVYGAPTVALDPLSPGLTSSSKRWTGAAQARAEVTAALAELAREDSVARDLYAARQRAIETLTVPGVAASSSPTGSKPATNVEQQVLQALERGDAAAIQGLADSMLGRRAATEARRDEGAPTTRAQIVTPGVLREPLPEACVPRAKALGFEPIEVTLASPEVSASISDFVTQYALGASPATFDRAREGVARVTVAAEVEVPRDLAAVFAETISLFALHLYVNSAGVRYVPLPAPREVLLVETHADGEEPVTPLLREFGFERRRGLSRDDIEAGLRRNGARVLAEHLGLDPLAFRIVCIPPDVFMRVGRDRSWGRREEWTHFDGYQVVSGGRLRALVGGNARFGGLADLCSISRDDARENTVARFAVIRRERLGVRIG